MTSRPGFDDYFMGIALAVRRRADCRGSRVGAVIVVDRRIVSTGYNGTAEGMANCTDGGCDRCANREKNTPRARATTWASASTRNKTRFWPRRVSASPWRAAPCTPRSSPCFRLPQGNDPGQNPPGLLPRPWSHPRRTVGDRIPKDRGAPARGP
ncbi:MAG: hypothetical protein IPH01_03445 [Elusimicrobia bacterium]|nr:hypothetical protein [Elusimicrobiota bacterium]